MPIRNAYYAGSQVYCNIATRGHIAHIHRTLQNPPKECGQVIRLPSSQSMWDHLLRVTQVNLVICQEILVSHLSLLLSGMWIKLSHSLLEFPNALSTQILSNLNAPRHHSRLGQSLKSENLIIQLVSRADLITCHRN